MKNFLSEFAGTFGFVFIGCGAAVFATPFIGYPGVALAFGLGYGAMLCAFKDGSFNPAVTLAALSCDRNGISWKSALLNAAGNIAAQIAGAFVATSIRDQATRTSLNATLRPPLLCWKPS